MGFVKKSRTLAWEAGIVRTGAMKDPSGKGLRIVNAANGDACREYHGDFHPELHNNWGQLEREPGGQSRDE